MILSMSRKLLQLILQEHFMISETVIYFNLV